MCMWHVRNKKVRCLASVIETSDDQTWFIATRNTPKTNWDEHQMVLH